ncbi:Uncharacterized membrane protein YdjX, TVP38/TMEM64 family, SNARE-associated domain [Clostridium cavendishii DSM 21758]|uniref:TVP38/TMEM64 family membrane protein n=1 Tax=Clostridium cavendishii DSM 21758 TaxID=1121302 RepID=A0A1M6T7Y0_9CLOT|nr:VTT domain-containing protein [Clostridium cavendishii]SHK53097.1 Uncharacterized membrane protein YdjX, TVP38/TMEM64 family, SNARE-associated domain [Clostridium cavendishii DSM 21758]
MGQNKNYSISTSINKFFENIKVNEAFIFINKNKMKIITVFSIIATVIITYLVRQNIEHLKMLMENKNELKEFLLSKGIWGMVMVLVFQICQVIIFFVPGEVFQTTAGYAYGTFLGSILCIVGMDIGGAMLFIATKKYGHGLVNRFLPKKAVDYFNKLLQSDNINLIVFLLYIIPGIPKDGSILVCGLSKIEIKEFLIYSTIGRLPAVILSCYYGANIAEGNREMLIILTTIIVVIVLGSYFLKEFIYKKLESVK